MTIASGGFSDVFDHPGFWVLYTKSFLWFLLAGFLASILTIWLASRRASSAK
jgi:hypothetical protein